MDHSFPPYLSRTAKQALGRSRYARQNWHQRLRSNRRDYLRYVLAADADLDVVIINDVADSATLARLLRYDSTFGPLRRQVDDFGDAIAVDGHKIAVSVVRDPAQLAWREHGVEIVIESTGKFRTRQAAAGHRAAGAHTVLISAPGKGRRRDHRAGSQRPVL